jgi:hypothetical protein
MFTVIIAEKDIIEAFEKYRLFLTPLLQSNNFKFCEWDPEAESINKMAPALHDMIAGQNDWRAVILQSAGRHQKNPFDYTGYFERDGVSRSTDWDKLRDRRAKRFECYEKAIGNPLTKLTSSLCGAPVSNALVDDRDLYNSIISGIIHPGEMILAKQLEQVNIPELVTGFKEEAENRKKLAQFTDEANRDKLLELLSEKDVAGIFNMIGADGIINFVKLIGEDDPRFSDPEYAEFLLENTKKAELFESLSSDFDFKDIPPSEVVCIALRTYDSEEYDERIQWTDYNEQDYSRFSEFNLYADKLKYIVYDIEENDHSRFENDLTRFCSLILIIAENEIPFGVMSKNRLYKTDCIVDINALSLLFMAYDTKLHKTLLLLKEKQEEALAEDAGRSSSESFIKVLETPVAIPLTLDKENSVNDLRVKYDKLGLSTNCPSDEHAYFEWQYFDLRKKFQQFLKQPRRSLIRATEDMRNVNAINDKEATYLNNFQIEDVMDGINDAEQNMVSTVTTNIYNTAKHNEMMEEARREVQQGIATRMTRRTTVVAGVIAVAAYFLGFIPLLISSFNTVASFAVSGLITLIVCGLFALCGFVCLFVLRNRLKNRFKHFNYVMGGIVSEITDKMQLFSKYLTHACTVMRSFSAVNRMKESEKTGTVKAKVLNKHIEDIKKTRDEFRGLFDSIDLSSIGADADFSQIEPYNYDFTLPEDYPFYIPFEAVPSGRIEFMQDGNIVEAHVGYVQAISLRREELYDN